jgi:outer membrane protein assembly factor BamA
MGIAPSITIETRDNFVYPRKGYYLEVMYYLYPSWSNESFSFRSFKLDARKYFPVKWISDIDVIAVQFLANINTGNVPFKDMADIGGSYTMRGYYTGYYRYNNLYAVQAEFRARIWKRLGFTTWIGAALTPLKWYTFGDNSVKPNAGIGLRIMLNTKDKLNVRVDQGFGKNQNGFYLDVAEAF